MVLKNFCAVIALMVCVGELIGEEVPPPPPELVEKLSLDTSFYRKHLVVEDLPIVSSAKVSDYAHKEAEFLIRKMLGHRPEVIRAIASKNVRLAIMAPDELTTQVPEHSDLTPKNYWDKRARGLGATKKRPAVSVGEENLLGLQGDPYAAESIMIHEFAHVIHQQGMNTLEPDFQKRLEQCFNRAVLKGLWKGKYAGTNPAEYWAEGVQSWFDTNRENDHDHNHVNTRQELREHDPDLAKLVESVFGDRDWRYVKPQDRAEPAHLAGFDRSDAPVFAWPKQLVKAYNELQQGKGLEKVKGLSLEDVTLATKSPGSATRVQLTIRNDTDKTLRCQWIDFEGGRRDYGHVDPGRKSLQNTFAGHLWVLVDENGKAIACCAAPEKDGMFVVE